MDPHTVSVQDWRLQRKIASKRRWGSVFSGSHSRSPEGRLGLSTDGHTLPAVLLSHELGALRRDESGRTVWSDRHRAKDFELLKWELEECSDSSVGSVGLFLEGENVVLRRGALASTPSVSVETPAGAAVECETKPADGSTTLCSMWRGKWAPLCSSEALSTFPLQRLACRKGGRGSAGWWSNVVALACNGGVQLQVTESGISEMQRYSCDSDDERMFMVNGTALDTWGDCGAVVGFSNGDVVLVDWRQDVARCGAALSASIPQPPWVVGGTVRGGRRWGGASSAGVLACCCFDTQYRVVCSLGDSKGAVVVSDLRYITDESKSKRKRTYSSREMTALASVGSVPMSAAVVDMRHSQEHFGKIGMVDSNGRGVVTSLSALERHTHIEEDRSPQGMGSLDAEVSKAVRPSERRLRPDIAVWHRTAAPGSSNGVWGPETISRINTTPQELRVEWQANNSDLAASLFSATPNGASELELLSWIFSTNFTSSVFPARSTSRCSLLSVSEGGRDFVLADTGGNTKDGSTDDALIHVGKTSLFSFGGQGGGLPVERGVRKLVLPRDVTALDQSEHFTAVSSLDDVVCFHSSSGNTVCAQL